MDLGDYKCYQIALRYDEHVSLEDLAMLSKLDGVQDLKVSKELNVIILLMKSTVLDYMKLIKEMHCVYHKDNPDILFPFKTEEEKQKMFEECESWTC